MSLRNEDIGDKLHIESIYDLIDKEIKDNSRLLILQNNKSDNIKNMDQN